MFMNSQLSLKGKYGRVSGSVEDTRAGQPLWTVLASFCNSGSDAVAVISSRNRASDIGRIVITSKS